MLAGVGVGLVVSVASAAVFGGDPTSGWTFWGGLAAGYLAKRRGLRASPAGFRVGLVGVVPAVVGLVESLGGEPRPAGLLGVAGVAVVLLCFFVIVGAFGGRLAERGGHPREAVRDDA